MVIISTVNLTVRVDENTKKDFDTFCENVGLNATAAVNMFIRNVVRTRILPFAITDINLNEHLAMAEMKRAIQSMQEQSVRIGNSDMSLNEINAEIMAYRQDRRDV